DAARARRRTIVIGGRLEEPEPDALPPGRLNAIRVAGFFVNWACGVKLHDTQSGFRVYPIELFDEVRVRRGGFVFETEVLVAGVARGWRVHEVSVAAIPRAREPRPRRALIAAQATAAAPILLGLLVLQAFAPRRMPDFVSPLVRWFCSQERLEAERSSLAAVVNPVGPPS